MNEQFPRLANPGPVLTDILGRFFPALLVPTKPANRSSSSWAFTYAFDQYFWQPEGDPKRGIGLFFAFGVSDGNPNPIQYSFLTGIGGKGVVPGRPDDSFGIGIARTEFSSDFVPFLRQQLNLGLQHEDAIEMYYNAAITSWLNATADLQIINPGLKKPSTRPGNSRVSTPPSWPEPAFASGSDASGADVLSGTPRHLCLVALLPKLHSGRLGSGSPSASVSCLRTL